MAESRDKEVAAFVERATRRLKEDPKASLSGRHRMAFVAVRHLVEAAASSGLTMKVIWETLSEEGRVSMTYETFRGHCRELGIGRVKKRVAAARASAGAGPQRAALGARAGTPSTPAAAPRPRAFRHDPVPDLEKIYGPKGDAASE